MFNNKGVTVQKYQGYEICFGKDNDHQMVNLTQMAKPFGKKVYDFLRQKQVREFIDELQPIQSGKSRFGVLHKTKGGAYSGTWGHHLLALKFAGWLAPAFEVWMMQRIYEMLTGSAEGNKPLQMPLFLDETAPLPFPTEEYREAQLLTVKLATAAGSTAQLARRLNTSPATLSCLQRGRFEYVKTPMLARLLTALRHIDQHGLGYDTELVELLMQVDDTEVRTKLFRKLKNTASL